MPTQPSTSRRRTARDKRDNTPAPHVVVLTAPKGAAFPAGRMLIASPLEIQRIVLQIPAGRVLTTGDLRAALAARFEADYTCPVTTGIFLRIAADAAQEERELGAAEGMPWWRVVRDDGALNDKLPGGVARQAEHLRAEGVEVQQVRGVPKRVADVAAVRWTPRH
jgi:alkylated DNA nucleotide flippase Atl1